MPPPSSSLCCPRTTLAESTLATLIGAAPFALLFALALAFAAGTVGAVRWVRAGVRCLPAGVLRQPFGVAPGI